MPEPDSDHPPLAAGHDLAAVELATAVRAAVAPLAIGARPRLGTGRLASWVRLFPQIAGAGVAAVGALVLVGWIRDVATLRAERPGWAPVQPGPALFFVVGGLALAFLGRRPAPRPRRWLGLACAGLATAWGGLHLIEYVAPDGSRLDEVVFSDLAARTAVPFAGSTSAWSAVLVGVLGWAPFFLNTRRVHWAGELLVVVPLSISFLGLVSEAFRVISTSGPAAEKASTLATTLPFLGLELGFLCARPDRGWMAVLTGPGQGGSLARRLLPVAVLVPFVMAWLRVVAEQAGLLGPAAGGILYAFVLLFVQSVLILWYAAAVNRTDHRRREAEAFVRSLLRIGTELNSTLDVHVLLNILIHETVRLVDAEGGVAGLRTVDGTVYRRYVRHGRPVPFDDGGPPGEGLREWVVDHKVPYCTNDARTDPRIDQTLRARFNVRSALSTPILDPRGEVLGFFEVHDKKGGGFTAGDQDRLLAVAQSAAGAIQNALAYHHLHAAEQALKAADRHKDEFLATLAHELRNPLAPLRNGLQVMRLAGHAPEAVDQTRAMMERQLGLMVRLIDDLLDLSRIGRGKVELRKERVPLADVVRQALETSRPVIDQAGHALTVRQPADPIFLDADVTRLAQVFSNLLNNAAKFTDPGGDIWLTVEHLGGEVVVGVRDTGVGIPAAMLPKVFDMFTQVDQSLEKSRGGLGIGLSLVWGLVGMHGGRVEARSEGPGTGSEFIVRLPTAPAPPATAPDPEAVRPAAGRRILVVDDNRDSAVSLALLLNVMGNETQTAHDGLEALDVGAAFRPDVVLLDLGMPRLNGYDTARRIRQEPWGRTVLLVAQTGWGQEDDRRRSREAGFDHHVVKPVEPAALEKLLGGLTPGTA